MLVELFKLQNQFDKKAMERSGTPKEKVGNLNITAFMVELGELMNEVQSHKHWKLSKVVNYAKAREEAIDCLHFAMSTAIQNDLTAMDIVNYFYLRQKEYNRDINTTCVRNINNYISCMKWVYGLEDFEADDDRMFIFYYDLAMSNAVDMKRNLDIKDEIPVYPFLHYCALNIGLCFLFLDTLGLTGDEIYQAYLDKNKVNHTRQEEGY